MQLHVDVRVHVEREPLRRVEDESVLLIQNVQHLQTVLTDAGSSSVLRASVSGTFWGFGNEVLATARKSCRWDLNSGSPVDEATGSIPAVPVRASAPYRLF